MAHAAGCSIKEVATEGPGLVNIFYNVLKILRKIEFYQIRELSVIE